MATTTLLIMVTIIMILCWNATSILHLFVGSGFLVSLFFLQAIIYIHIYIYILAYCRQSRSYMFYNYGLSFDSYVNIKICHLLLIIECYRPLFIRLHTRNLKFTNPRALVLSV